MMKKIILATVTAVIFSSSYVFAHHPAQNIVDEDIWAMIDANVADTPHADLDLDDMGGADSPAPGNDSDLGPGNSGDMGSRAASNDARGSGR